MTMKFIPTRVHGILDYVVGAMIIAAPWLFGFDDVEAAKWVTLSSGASALLYSLCTDYEFGAFKLIPMNVHLILDILSGLFMIASPWIFGFADELWMPQVAIGCLEIFAALMTRTKGMQRQLESQTTDDIQHLPIPAYA